MSNKRSGTESMIGNGYGEDVVASDDKEEEVVVVEVEEVEEGDISADLNSDFPSLGAAMKVPYDGSDAEEGEVGRGRYQIEQKRSILVGRGG